MFGCVGRVRERFGDESLDRSREGISAQDYDRDGEVGMCILSDMR